MNTYKTDTEAPGKSIDCLFIGHYEMECQRHIDYLKKAGNSEEILRELTFSVLFHQGKPYYGADILNLFYREAFNTPKPFFDHWGGMSLAIAYLATYLTRRGYTFDYVNSFQNERTGLARKLEQENIRLIAIPTTYYVSYLPVLEIIRFVRNYNRTAKIVVGGPFVHNQVFSLNSPEALKTLFEMIDADIYVDSAQGEATLVKVLEALKRDLPLENINNLYYRTERGYAATPVEIENNRLAENLVDWRLVARSKSEYVNVRTAISCPFKCAFCGFRVRAGKYQRLEIDEIETELELLNQVQSVKTVQFIDDTINTPTERFRKFLKMLSKKNFRFKWISWLRCDNIDEEIARMMKESGCIGVLMGIESGNNQILKNMNKGVTIEKYLKGLEYLRKFDILTYGSFIFGFPGETEKTAADTIRFIEESGIEFYGPKIWIVEPFSAVMAEKEKYKITGSLYRWSHRTMNSEQAIAIKEQAFLDIKNALHMPDIQFHFQNVLHLINKGMQPATLKSFLTGFNQGLAQRMTGISYNITPEVIVALRRDSLAAFKECHAYPDNPVETVPANPKNLEKADRDVSDVDFDL